MEPTFKIASYEEPVEKESKNDYYKDNSSVSFSDLKVFSRCETLYRDQKIIKTYEEPEQDYFTYGKLVDAMVSEGPLFIADNFVRVDRKVKVEDALKFEGKIESLKGEILDLAEKVAAENKTAIRGVEKRTGEIVEYTEKLNVIRDVAGKTQVTNALWEEAESTAMAIKAHPTYPSMEWNTITSQQVFRSTIRGIPRRGKLDYLKVSPAIQKFYALYKANQISEGEMRGHILTLNSDDIWARIVDIKTCADLAKLEPYNNHYRGQLGYYQELVSSVLGIPIERIQCYILVADKVNNRKKKAELFVYTQESLDEIKPDVEIWVQKWMIAMKTGNFVSAKAKYGMDQKCFTCSECSFCPFSIKAGEPVVVTGPRFGKSNFPGSKVRPGIKEIIDMQLEDAEEEQEEII